MTHFRIYLNSQKSNASQTFNTFLICSNKSYGSDNGLVSFLRPGALGQWTGLLSRVVHTLLCARHVRYARE